MEKVKIVLDADVIFHFHKGEKLLFLPDILDEYEHVVLSHVRDEILYEARTALDHQIAWLRNLTLIDFDPQGEMAKEYARLRRKFGKGESACMAYCKLTNNVVGSSNIKDIKAYCTENHITYLTTYDFLYYAWIRKKISEEEIHAFIKIVKDKGSNLHDFDLSSYHPNVML